MRRHAQLASGGIEHAPGLPFAEIAIIAVLLAALAVYLLAARRASLTGKPWSRARSVSFTAGIALLMLGFGPPVSSWAHLTFQGHMIQHLLIGMLGPIFLVLAAPITLVLRSVPPATGRRISRLLRSAPMHLLANPITALILSAGGLYLIYLTPIYNASHDSSALHWLIHLHFLLAGCLFAWVIAGPDPAPNRPAVRTRLVILGAAVVLHGALSQLIYANAFINIDAPTAQLQTGATLMYYGGDIAEIILAVALLAAWRPAPRLSPVSQSAAIRIDQDATTP